jgi:hypothetical protein
MLVFPCASNQGDLMMSSIRNAIAFALLVCAVAAGTASAPTPSAAQSVSGSAKSTTDDVSKWTRKEWNQAKAKWSQKEAEWATCNKRATDQRLRGRKSWLFLYDCMMSFFNDTPF